MKVRKAIIALSLAIISMIAPSTVAAQSPGDLTVFAAYTKQTVNPIDEWGGVNAGASYTMRIYRNLHFLPDARLGYRHDFSGMDLFLSLRPNIGFRVVGCALPVTVFTGPMVDIAAVGERGDTGTPYLGELTWEGHVIPYWQVGLSFGFRLLTVRAAYAFPLLKDSGKQAESFRPQQVEIAVGWNFHL